MNWQILFGCIACWMVAIVSGKANRCPQTRNEFEETGKLVHCSLCIDVIQLAMAFSTFEQQSVQAELHAMCNGIPFYAQYCNKMVIKKFDQMWDLINTNATSQSMCTTLKLCHDQSLTTINCTHQMDCPKHNVSTFITNSTKLANTADTHAYGGKPKRYNILGPNDGAVKGPQELLHEEPIDLDYIHNLFDPDPEVGLKFAARFGLIANSRLCPDPACAPHARAMTLVVEKDAPDGFKWRCPECKTRQQTTKLSVRSGSIFENNHLTLYQVFKLSFLWATYPVMTLDQIATQVSVSKPVIVEYYLQMRDVAENWCLTFLMQGNQLGGVGRIVEIDESKFYKVKHNNPHARPRAYDGWVFGMIERGTNKLIMVEVADRTAQTLVQIIQTHVMPGTTVISDGWAAYGGIRNLQQAYTHHTIIHNLHFVDPNNPAIHTQSIEATWGAIKRSMKHLCGTSQDFFPTYLFNYMFRRYYKREHIFVRFWQHVARMYPVPA